MVENIICKQNRTMTKNGKSVDGKPKGKLPNIQQWPLYVEMCVCVCYAREREPLRNDFSTNLLVSEKVNVTQQILW